jgi:hypothetical protein
MEWKLLFTDETCEMGLCYTGQWFNPGGTHHKMTLTEFQGRGDETMRKEKRLMANLVL